MICEVCAEFPVPITAGESQRMLGLCDRCYKIALDSAPELPTMLGNLIKRPIGQKERK